MGGDFKHVCVVCRTRREMRAHHCKECGRCVRRLDHHCPWVDNCVGLSNQRTFFCFIWVIFASIVVYYYIGGQYIAINVFSVHGDAPKWSAGCIIILISWVLDGIFLLFILKLLARHLAFVAANVTTYEVLVRPPHVQRRFSTCTGTLWFLEDCSLLQAMRNCVSYW